MADKVRELAGKQTDALHETTFSMPIKKGEIAHVLERILRAELKTLLVKGEKLLLIRRRGSDFDADRAADEFREELEGWATQRGGNAR